MASVRKILVKMLQFTVKKYRENQALVGTGHQHKVTDLINVFTRENIF